MGAKSKNQRKPGRPATGRTRKAVCVTIGPEVHASLLRIRKTDAGMLTASVVIEMLLLEWEARQ